MIEFICGTCGKKYRTLNQNLGKKVICKDATCKSVILINPISNSAARRRMILSAVFGIILLIGCLYKAFFPLPLVAVCIWATWLMIRKKDALFLKMLTSILNTTAIGLFALFVIMALLNIFHHQGVDDPPFWLYTLDDILIWSRDHLKYLADINLWIFILVTSVLLALSAIFPKWPVLEKFTKAQEIQGKLTSVLIIITSFTFFAPQKINDIVNDGYYRWYRAIYREELKQDRISLIAGDINKSLISHSLPSNADLSMVQFEIKKAVFPSNGSPEVNIKDNAHGAAIDIMEFLGYENESDINPSAEHTEDPDDNWKRKCQQEDWHKKRRNFVEEEYASLSKRRDIAAEKMETLKNTYLKLFAKILPDGMNELFGVYIEEFVNTIGEYFWNKMGVEKIVNNIFEYLQSKKFNLFAFTAKVSGKSVRPENTTVRNQTNEIINSPASNNSKPSFHTARCGRCNREVSPDSHPGMSCPHCGAFWAYESETTGY